MENQLKFAAAMAAVNRYLELESSENPSPSEDFRGSYGRAAADWTNIWGVSGRQNQMQLRTLMQLRTFKKGAP